MAEGGGEVPAGAVEAGGRRAVALTLGTDGGAEEGVPGELLKDGPGPATGVAGPVTGERDAVVGGATAAGMAEPASGLRSTLPPMVLLTGGTADPPING